MSKKIFISGGSKGIGLAIAQKFHKKGYQVIICARGEEGLEAAKAAIPGIITYTCDMADKKEVKKMGKHLTSNLGPMDVVVNNAGVFLQGNMFEEDDSAYERTMATNMDSAYYLTKSLLPAMIERQKGTIINICSIASLQAYPGGGSYGISKYALLGFSKILREEMKEFGIKVISIMPGAVKTASWEGVDIPASRLMPASDIAKICWSVCSLSDRTVVEDIVVRPFLGDL